MKKLLFTIALFCGLLILSSCDSSTNSSTPQYTVALTPSPAEGGSVSATSQVYDEGSVATIAATAASEWVFARWEGDFTGLSSTSTLTVDSDKNITAIFEKKNYALNVNTSGEGTVDEQIIQAKSTDYESGTVVELTAIPSDGWGFIEWQGAVTSSENPVQITVDDPKQITAVFESFYLDPNGVTVKCDSAKVGATGSVNGITYTKRTAGLITINNAATSCTSGMTDMSSLFSGELSFNEDISSWDVSSVTDMGSMFSQATAFNQDISYWDVSAVTDMNLMFSTANTFNQDLTDWNVSAVTNMRLMFSSTATFNGDISSWDVSSVLNMEGIFFQSTSFNGDISSWDVSAVTDMGAMFAGAPLFNGDLSNWEVSAVTNINNMFNGAVSFNGDISNWDVSSVTVMSSLFRGASSFNQDLSSWNVSAVTQMSRVFFQASSFNGNLNSWDVSSVITMNSMFLGATSFNQDLSSWDVGTVFDMEDMFNDAVLFNQNLSGWCVSNIPSEPTGFSTNSPLTTPNKPVWGTCPGS